MITIDHLGFPHIIDLIWEEMSFPSLIAASQTCRAWHMRALPQIAEHVSIRKGGGEGPDRVLIVSARNLHYPDASLELGRGTVNFWSFGVRASLPLQPWHILLDGADNNHNSDRLYWIEVFKHTRIVDWHGFRSLGIAHVGILPIMLLNRLPNAADLVWRLFENFAPGETLSESLDWLPSAVFCDFDPKRGLAVPRPDRPGSIRPPVMHLGSPLRFSRGKVNRIPDAPWYTNSEFSRVFVPTRVLLPRDVVLHVRCFSDPCTGLMNTEWGQSYVTTVPVIVTPGRGDVQISLDRLAALVYGIRLCSSKFYGLERLLPQGITWDEELLRIAAKCPPYTWVDVMEAGYLARQSRYDLLPWPQLRQLWSTLRDYESRNSVDFLLHTVR